MTRPGRTVEASGRAIPETALLGGRLAGKTLVQQVAVLAVWPLLEQILTFCVGATDLVIAGRMAGGAERVAILDAMGLASYVAWFFNILQVAVATGVMALVSRAVGGRDQGLADRGLGQGMWLGLAAGILSLWALLAGARTLIGWIGLGPEAAAQAEIYLRVFAWSGPFSGMMFAINAALRGAGDTRTPFIGMLVVNLVNMVVSASLVFAPAPLGGHGIAGIAWGTVIGWASGLTVVSVLVGLPKGVLRWSRQAVALHMATMMRIVRIGAPQALEIAGMWGIHAYGIRVISRLPVEGALGAHILAIRVESMSFLPGFAIGTAAAALVGQYLGAGSKSMAMKSVHLCWKVAVAIMGAMGIVFVLWGKSLIGLMAPGSALHENLAAPLLIICALEQPFFATCIVIKTAIRGAGATAMVVRYAFLSMLFFRVGVLAVLSALGQASLMAVWIVFASDIFAQALIFSYVHFRGKWLDARV